MKAYKVELLIIDHDELEEDGVKDVIEHTRYHNRCVTVPTNLKVRGFYRN